MAGSAILICKGIRKRLRDLDITIINPDVWEKFLERKTLEKSESTDEMVVLLEEGQIEVKDSFLKHYTDIDLTDSQNIEKIDGIQFLTLDCVEKYKKVLNRPKDRRDLVLIEKYKSEQS